MPSWLRVDFNDTDRQNRDNIHVLTIRRAGLSIACNSFVRAKFKLNDVALMPAVAAERRKTTK